MNSEQVAELEILLGDFTLKVRDLMGSNTKPVEKHVEKKKQPTIHSVLNLPETSVKLCAYVYKSGKKQNDICGKKLKIGDYCSAHCKTIATTEKQQTKLQLKPMAVSIKDVVYPFTTTDTAENIIERDATGKLLTDHISSYKVLKNTFLILNDDNVCIGKLCDDTPCPQITPNDEMLLKNLDIDCSDCIVEAPTVQF